jgi:PAP2 superfamily protein
MRRLVLDRRRLLVTMIVTFIAAGRAPDRLQAGSGNAVLAWNAVATEAFLPTQGTNPVTQSRTYSMMHAAIHDVLNAIEPRYTPYTSGLPASPGASPDAAVAAAAKGVLAALIPDQKALVEQAYTSALATIRDDAAKVGGIALGETAAKLILQRRAGDGALEAFDTPYLPTGIPGDYTFTPPFEEPPLGPLAFAPGWGGVTPFGIDLRQHHLPGPLPLKSAAYATDFALVKAIGDADSTTRTEEQSLIARFWYEDAPIGWNRIASTVLSQEAVGLWKSARVLALVNFAMADGFIAGFDAKYEFRFWRPVTAIREASLDGNRFTEPDPGWSPYLTTPPVPDYPSTHTVLGAAAAEVLIQFFGDRCRFSTTSTTAPGVVRTFQHFSDAAIENGESRVYAGIHFVKAVIDGYKQGAGIGHKIGHMLPRVR